MTSLTDFLLQRIAEDEAAARRVLDLRWQTECEVKRRIVERISRKWDREEASGLLRLLALSFASHPDYQREWAL